MLKIEAHGKLPTGEAVESITLVNATGSSLRALTYGGIVTSLHVPDRCGVLDDVVLGFDSLDAYLAGHPYFGAITGRVAGRIPGGRFTVDGTTTQLALNEGPNHLHGGLHGLDKRIWHAEAASRVDGAPSVRLSRHSAHGEEGYPGNLAIAVTYTLTDANEFIIETEASSDRPTPLSLTHHSYFNLAGEGREDIMGHELQVHADLAMEVDEHMTPTGRAHPVAGQAADFNQARRLAAAVPRLFQQHGDLYLLRREQAGALVPAARFSDSASGRVLTVSTTESCLQLYTGASLDGSLTGKSSRPYPRHAGICLECQGYPGAVDTPGFGNILVHPERPQRHRTVYAFSTA